MSSILVGVDAPERSADAVVFARRLDRAREASVVLGGAFPDVQRDVTRFRRWR
jgi:hypothetical protein